MDYNIIYLPLQAQISKIVIEIIYRFVILCVLGRSVCQISDTEEGIITPESKK